MDDNILRMNEEIVVEFNNDLASFQEDIKKQKDDLKLLKQKQRDNIAEAKRLVNERRNETTSMETEIEKILTKYKVAIQVYHCGTLTGVACKTLLKETKLIMSEIEAMLLARVRQMREIRNLPLQPPSDADVQNTMKRHKQLFVLQDQVYSHLRIVDPKEAELKRTEEVIKDMSSLWKLMNLPETHKVHLLFAHAAIDQRCFGGFGDKDEEWVEKLLQEQKIMNQILLRQVGGFKKQMKTQFDLHWRNTHPAVQEQLILLYLYSSTRKMSTVLVMVIDLP